MNDYEEKILTLLVEKYRKSKKDSGTGVIHRRTQIKPTDVYKGYDRNDAEPEMINGVNEVVERCLERGFLTYEKKKFSNEIATIYLVDEKITEVEAYLANCYQYESKPAKMKQVEEIIEKYSGYAPITDQECEKLRESLDKNIVPKEYKRKEEVLKALLFIEQNKQLLYVREASMIIYGSSKYLEDNTLEDVCRLIRKFHNRSCEENELLDEILEEYGVVKEKQRICLKGNLIIVMKNERINLKSFRNGIEFSAEEMEHVEKIMISDRRFMTVENKTAYMRCDEEDTAYFYLGGYANRFQRECLKKIYADNPGVEYYHFGDIDAGGFYIYENLCRITGIAFQMYKMSVLELGSQQYAGCLQRLSENDRKRLQALKEYDKFGEVVQYMLENDVKLEQEIVCYFEKRRG